MTEYFICTIGPVQEFIATARRSRDLWFGSWMLSELSKAAALRITTLPQPGELIFPVFNNATPDSIASLAAPNKIVAILPGDPAGVATEVLDAIKGRLNKLWETISIMGSFNLVVAQKQIDDLIEFSWVSVPYDASAGDGYTRARSQAESVLAARKTTRNFIQPGWSSNAPKSSLDGARESVIPASAYPNKSDNPQQVEQKIQNLYKNFHARRGEQLSGVDLLKRNGSRSQEPDFRSTSDIAAIPFFKRLDPNTRTPLLDKLKELLPPDTDPLEGRSEGLIFESRLQDAFPSQKELVKNIKDQHRNLLKDLPTPNPYYALLAADGDFMGKYIDALPDKRSHQDTSSKLSSFARQAEGIVKKYDGCPIYCGGDDVLAYLPLHTVLDCASELNAEFIKLWNHIEKGNTPTLSVGVAIAHHLEPLSDSLKLARDAEKSSKKVEGKNGLTIILSKRGGADRAVSGKLYDLRTRLKTLIGWFSANAISHGAAYELQRLHSLLSKGSMPPSGLAKEASRILARKRESGGVNKVPLEVTETLSNWITGVIDSAGIPANPPQPMPLDELARLMIIAAFLATK